MSKHRVPRKIALALIAALFGSAGPVWAQFCPDTPVRVGLPAAAGSVGFSEEATAYTLGIQAAPRDHLVLNASYGLGIVDGHDTSHSVSLGGAYQKPLADGALCPWGAVDIGYGFGVDEFARGFATGVSVGVTAGVAAYEDERFRLTPFARPSYAYAVRVVDMFDGGWEDSWSVATGALLQLRDQVFATGTASFGRNGYSGFSLRLGWMLH